MNPTEPLSGIMVPMITPLMDNRTLDINGLERLIEHIINGAVSGLFILGTTGEGPSLSSDLRHELIERVCRQVDKRVPILVSISDTAVTESLRLADKAAYHGAYAVVSTPPYYYPVDQSDLVDYFGYLSHRLELPLYLYNMPSHTRVVLEPETVRNIADNKNVIGLKDSSANFVYFQNLLHVMRELPDFSLTVGPEEGLMQSILAGANGGVNGGANMFPHLYVKMYEAAVSRDFEKMISLQKIVLKISAGIYNTDRSKSAYLRGLKTVLSLMGICNDFLSEPLRQLGKQERAAIDRNYQELVEDLSSMNIPVV
jgi:2-dehydro-3-deoxy-D-pentonate aldolase